MTDSFWKDHVVSFPSAWPEKANLAVSILDPDAWPSKYRLLNNDPVVLSFWRFLGLAQQLFEAAKLANKKYREAAAKDDGPDAQRMAKDAKELMERRSDLISKARVLQRNVPITFIYCPSEKFRQDEALSLREDVEFLRDMCGLSGWDRVCIVGAARDSLRTALNRSIRAEELVENLKNVRWSAGREITQPVVEKWIPLYDKFSACAEVVAIIRKAQALLHRASPFEDWSKLVVISGRFANIPETCWAMESLMYDQINRKVDSFSKSTLNQRHGPLGIYALRKKTMDGLSAEYLKKTITTVREALVGKPDLKDTLEALEACDRTYSSVSTYQSSKSEGQTSTPSRAQFLPSWVTVHYCRLARQVMDGMKDKVLTGLLLKPPAGGVGVLKFTEHLRELDGLSDPIQALDKAMKSWIESTVSMGGGGGQAPPAGGGGGGQAPPAAGGKTPQAPEGDRLATLRTEISDVAKDLRIAFVPMVLRGDSALQCERNIQATSTFKGSGGSSARLCYIYAVPLSWELPLIRGKKKRRPTPLLDDDFTAFADTTSRLITAENEGYAVVLMGRAGRPGAGLLSEVGLSVQVAVVNAMKEKSKGTFRAKQIRLNMRRQTGQTPSYARGVGGSMSENVFFFYKGTWPSKLELDPREHFGGTPWDDMWLDVPLCPGLDEFSVPPEVKKMVFDDLWSAQSTQQVEDGLGKDATDEEDDGAGQAASSQGKKDSKDAKGAKEKKGAKSKKEAKTKKDATDAKGKKDAKDPKGKPGKADGKDPKDPKDPKGKPGKADDKGAKNKPGQKDAPKKKTGQKSTKKKGAKEATGKKGVHGNMLKESRALIAAPAVFGDEKRDPENEEPLFSNDYHPSVWSACWKEWKATRGVLWTAGNGTAGGAGSPGGVPVVVAGYERGAFAVARVLRPLLGRHGIAGGSPRQSLTRQGLGEKSSEGLAGRGRVRRRHSASKAEEAKGCEGNQEERLRLRPGGVGPGGVGLGPGGVGLG